MRFLSGLSLGCLGLGLAATTCGGSTSTIGGGSPDGAIEGGAGSSGGSGSSGGNGGSSGSGNSAGSGGSGSASSGGGGSGAGSGNPGSSGAGCAVCTLYCPYGMVSGPNGCPQCLCNPAPDAGHVEGGSADASTGDAGSRCGVDSGPCCPNTLNRLPCDTGLMCCMGVPYPTNGRCLSACVLRSDRNLKRDIEPVDERAVLDAVMHMPVSTWSYKTDDPSVRHLGPMAQDFYSAFNLGDTDRGYYSVDAHGVALAAIKALAEQLQEQSARIERLERDNRELRAQAACGK
jgi:hypothetical protein